MQSDNTLNNTSSALYLTQQVSGQENILKKRRFNDLTVSSTRHFHTSATPKPKSLYRAHAAAEPSRAT